MTIASVETRLHSHGIPSKIRITQLVMIAALANITGFQAVIGGMLEGGIARAVLTGTGGVSWSHSLLQFLQRTREKRKSAASPRS